MKNEQNPSFSQRVLLTLMQYVIPSFLALAAAVLAGGAKNASTQAKDASVEVDVRLRAIQSRLDERDLVSHENYDNTLLVPVGDDEMWRDYFDLVKNKGYERKDAARAVLQKRTSMPSSKIADEVWSK